MLVRVLSKVRMPTVIPLRALWSFKKRLWGGREMMIGKGAENVRMSIEAVPDHVLSTGTVYPLSA